MRKVFFSLAVVIFAISTNTFTNAKSNSTFLSAYVTDLNLDTQEYTFELENIGSITCHPPGLPLPCSITPITYSLPAGTNKIAKSLVDDITKTTWNSSRASY